LLCERGQQIVFLIETKPLPAIKYHTAVSMGERTHNVPAIDTFTTLFGPAQNEQFFLGKAAIEKSRLAEAFGRRVLGTQAVLGHFQYIKSCCLGRYQRVELRPV